MRGEEKREKKIGEELVQGVREKEGARAISKKKK